MNRKEFLSGLGIAGFGSLVSGKVLFSKTTASPAELPVNCPLIPTETAGPFPLDLTENDTFFRQDVREDRTGVQLNLRLKIIGASNCEPMPNVRVNIWHCDKDGLYSGYSQNNNPGQAGLTYLRGYQIADASGEVEFITILPGWYTGRICHIHFQVYVSSSYSAISQLTFDTATKNAIYTANAGLYTKGIDPLSYNNDNIFSDGYEYQVATLTPNADTGAYDSYLEVTVQGEGVVGLGHLEKETAKQFNLGQNYPNPYVAATTIPYELKHQSSIIFSLFDLSGKKIYSFTEQNKHAGSYQLELNMEKLGIPSGSYVYQMEVRNANGTYHLCKMMTAK